MNEFSAWIDYAAWAAGALAVVFAGGLWQRRQRRVVRGLQTALASQGERLLALERDLVALLSCSRGIAERLSKSETQQRRVQSELDKLHSADDNQIAVTHAMKLLNSGVDLQNVSDLCELSEGEVEILQNLARHRQAA